MQSRRILAVRPSVWTHCYAFLAAAALAGCDRQQSTTATPTNVEQTISDHLGSPIGDSIDPITKSLAAQSIFVGTESVTPTEDGKAPGKIRLKVGADNQGRLWVYAFTSRAEFDKAFPQGGAFAEMSFPDVFEIVAADSRFAGIFLNSASKTSYPIPRELFDRMKRVLSGMNG